MSAVAVVASPLQVERAGDFSTLQWAEESRERGICPKTRH